MQAYVYTHRFLCKIILIGVTWLMSLGGWGGGTDVGIGSQVGKRGKIGLNQTLI